MPKKKKTYQQMMDEILKPKTPREQTKKVLTVGGGVPAKLLKI